jgi:hypothetical protein
MAQQGIKKLLGIVDAYEVQPDPRAVVAELLRTATETELADLLLPAALVVCQTRADRDAELQERVQRGLTNGKVRHEPKT